MTIKADMAHLKKVYLIMFIMILTHMVIELRHNLGK